MKKEIKLLLLIATLSLMACGQTPEEALNNKPSCNSTATLSSYKEERFKVDESESSSKLNIYYTDEMTSAKIEALLDDRKNTKPERKNDSATSDKLKNNKISYLIKIDRTPNKKGVLEGILKRQDNKKSPISFKLTQVKNDKIDDSVFEIEVKPDNYEKVITKSEFSTLFDSKVCYTTETSQTLTISADGKEIVIETTTEQNVETKAAAESKTLL